MVDVKAFFSWLGVSAFILISANLICGDPLPTQGSGNFLDDIAAFFGTDGCTGTSDWVTWLILLIVGGGATVIIGSFIVPLIAGLAANSIAGTFAAIAGLTAIVALLASVFI